MFLPLVKKRACSWVSDNEKGNAKNEIPTLVMMVMMMTMMIMMMMMMMMMMMIMIDD